MRVAIVTGAGSGIGKSAALALLQDGYCVGLVGRRKDKLEGTADESGAKDRALVLPGDITKDAEVKHLFAEVKGKWGRLDVLFNNAGIGAPAVPMEDLPIEKFREVVNVNLVAMFLCTQEAIRIDVNPRRRRGCRSCRAGPACTCSGIRSPPGGPASALNRRRRFWDRPHRARPCMASRFRRIW